MRAGSLFLAVALLAGTGVAQEIGTVRVAHGLAEPVYVAAAPEDHERLFILERLTGRIKILDLSSGLLRAAPFLTVEGLGGQGLLGLAFHPDYMANGRLYVYFATSGPTFPEGETHVQRYTRSLDDDVVDPASGTRIITISNAAGHNGGWIGFGPDGYLYVSVGDGAGFHDDGNESQTTVGNLLGSVLRIDVNGDDFPGDANRNYSIPPDNPFVDVSGENEYWAYGLRNPWRASFDRMTGDFWIGDVGEDAREEVDFQPASSAGGENYGWRRREGKIATPSGGVGGPLALEDVNPILDYEHGGEANEGFSITGGYVYRGPLSELRGRYFFGDYVSERIWSIRYDGMSVTERIDWTAAFVPNDGAINEIVSFGEDAAGNLYVVDLGGEIFRVTRRVQAPGLSAIGLSLLIVSLLGIAAFVSYRTTVTREGPRVLG